MAYRHGIASCWMSDDECNSDNTANSQWNHGVMISSPPCRRDWGGGGGWMRSSQIKGETRLSCTMGDLMGGQERKVGLAAQKLTTLDRGRRFLFWTIRQTAVHRPPWYAR